MERVKVADIKKWSLQQLEAGHAVLYLGPPGIGKTEVAHQVADELSVRLEKDIKVVVLNASQISRDDMAIPRLREDGTVELATYDFDNTLLLIDEITNARPDAMSALLSLILEHKIGNRSFKNLYIVATGNRSTESTLARPLPRPMIERFVVFDFPTPTPEEWTDYMLSHRASEVYAPYVLFVKDRLPGELYYDDSDSGEVADYRQRPSPRGHTRAAVFLGKHYKDVHPSDLFKHHSKDVIYNLSGMVGKEAAQTFMTYLSEASDFLSWKEYLSGRSPENISQALSLIMSAASTFRPNAKEISELSSMATNKAVAELDRRGVLEAIDKLIGVMDSNSELKRLRTFVAPAIIGTSPSARAVRSKIAQAVLNGNAKDKYRNLHKLVSEATKAYR